MSINQAKKAAGNFVVAIDFGGTKVALATANREGGILEQARIETEAELGAKQAIERTLGVARRLMEHTSILMGGRCVAAGAVSPGIIQADRILLAPNVPGWGQLTLLDTVRDGLELTQVAVGNDVKAATMAELRWGSLRGADPAVYLNLGTGVAAALIIHGRVLTGAHGASGEIGYSLRGVAGEQGAAEGRAPLEEAIGGRAIGERGSKVLGGNLTAADIFASTDKRAQAFVDEVLAELSLHVANLAILIDPARIAVGGGLMSSGERILDVLTSRLRSTVPFPPEVVPARFVHDAALRGAIALALSTVGDSR
jgi:glucokinase